MVQYENTIPLTEFDIDTQFQMADLAVQKKIKLYGVSNRYEVQLVPLYPGQIQYIISKHPNKACIIIIDANPNNLYVPKEFIDHYVSSGQAIEVGISNLRIEKSIAEEYGFKIHKGKIKDLDSGSYGAILGALIELILDKSIGMKPSKEGVDYHSSEAIVIALENRFGKELRLRGFSESSLDRKFSEAKKCLQLLKDNS